MGKILVAYFSRTGITKALARAISVKLEADLFPINPAKAYSSSYLKCVFDAKIEQLTDALPLTLGKPQKIDKYTTVVLCFPIWWHSCPNIILTFLSENNFYGKRIIPVCTYGSSGKGHSLEDMKKASPKSTFCDVIEASAYKDQGVSKVCEQILQINK